MFWFYVDEDMTHSLLGQLAIETSVTNLFFWIIGVYTCAIVHHGHDTAPGKCCKLAK